MDEQQLVVWSGTIAAAVVSLTVVGAVAILIMRRKVIDHRALLILCLLVVACIGLVGNAPWIAIIQSFLVTMGLLAAIVHYTVVQSSPKPAILGLLVSALLISAILSGASRRFDIGLQKWFTAKVEPDSPSAVAWSAVVARPAWLETVPDTLKDLQGQINVLSTKAPVPGVTGELEKALSAHTVIAGRVTEVDTRLTELTRNASNISARLTELESHRDLFKHIAGTGTVSHYSQWHDVDGTSYQLKVLQPAASSDHINPLTPIPVRLRHKDRKSEIELNASFDVVREVYNLSDDDKSPLLLRLLVKKASPTTLDFEYVLLAVKRADTDSKNRDLSP